MNLPATRSELMASGACKIAEASSEAPGKSVWTRLSLWWLEDEDRPYIAVVEGLASRADLEDRFRAHNFGSISRALAWFEASDLRDKLVAELPADLAKIFPDANDLRSQRAAKNAESRGYRGPVDMRQAVDWLYENSDASVSSLAKKLESDFGVPWRTALNSIQGGTLSGWATGFLASLRFFDRKAWARSKMDAEQRSHDATSAIDDCEFPAPYGRHPDGTPRQVTECD